MFPHRLLRHMFLDSEIPSLCVIARPRDSFQLLDADWFIWVSGSTKKGKCICVRKSCLSMINVKIQGIILNCIHNLAFDVTVRGKRLVHYLVLMIVFFTLITLVIFILSQSGKECSKRNTITTQSAGSGDPHLAAVTNTLICLCYL